MKVADQITVPTGLIGVVHLIPFPGDPAAGHDMNFEGVILAALRDAEALVKGGMDGLIVENLGSSPFKKGTSGHRLLPHEVACDGGQLLACSNLGQLYLQSENGDRERGLTLLSHSCRMGEPRGCTNLAISYLTGSPEEREEAPLLLQEACTERDPLACTTLGSLYVTGDLFDLDSDKAVEYFRLSCDLDEPIGCYNLGVMYFDGTGVDTSPVLAESLFQKACDRGYEIACNMMRLESDGD